MLITAIALALVSFGLGTDQASRGCRQNVHPSTGSLRFDCLHGHRSRLARCRRSRRHGLRRTGPTAAIDLSIVLAFGSLIGLVILLFSKKAGSDFAGFIARNFYRSKYDYRARWLESDETFPAGDNQGGDHRLSFRPLDQGFPTTTISIWSFRESDRRFFKMRPIAAESSGSTLIELSHPVVMQLMNDSDPVSVKTASHVYS